MEAVGLQRLDVVGRVGRRQVLAGRAVLAALQQLPGGAPAGVVLRQPVATEQPVLAGRDEEAFEVAHQVITPWRFRALTRTATSSSAAARNSAAIVIDDRQHRVPVVVVAEADRGQQQEPAERDRDQQLPAEVHQLVVAQAGQRRPQPDVHVEEDERLGDEPDRALDAAGDERDVEQRLRPAEEQRDDDGAHRDRVHELGEEEQGEAERRVLGVEAADELLLGLDEVERRAVQLGGGGDHEHDERHDARWRRGSSRRTCPGRCTMPDVASVPDASSTAATLRPSAAS